MEPRQIVPIAQQACKTHPEIGTNQYYSDSFLPFYSKFYLAWTRWSSSHSNSNQQATQGLPTNPSINPNFEFDKLVVVPEA